MAESRQQDISEQLTRLTVTTELLHNGITERFLHFDRKLENLVNKFEKLQSVLEGAEGIVVRIDRLEQYDGKDLILRVDRLEQTETRRSKLVWITLGASIAAVCAAVARLFVGN